jgi:hypothetical protein
MNCSSRQGVRAPVGLSAISMRTPRILLLIFVMAALGLGGFVYLSSRTITVEQAEQSDAARQFLAVRASFGSAVPMLEVDASGHIVQHASPTAGEAVHLERLRVLVFQAHRQRLVRADVPFWFVTLKGPALQYALRDTGVDLDRLGVTAADLDRHGPGPILDETRADGDRILVWVE